MWDIVTVTLLVDKYMFTAFISILILKSTDSDPFIILA